METERNKIKKEVNLLIKIEDLLPREKVVGGKGKTVFGASQPHVPKSPPGSLDGVMT